MPLTNAEKQKRTRQRKADRLDRYEAALSAIADPSTGVNLRQAQAVAYVALHGYLRAQLQQSVRQGD